MKRFGVAILLAALCLTTACPQAGQVLSPSTFSASNPKEDDVPADNADGASNAPEISPIAPKSDPADVDNPTKVSANKPGFDPDIDLSKGNELSPQVGIEKNIIAANGPIEPKSDSGNVTINSIQEFRLRYGTNFDQTLPASPSLPFLIAKSDQPQTLSYLVDVGIPAYNIPWAPPVPNQEGQAYPVRLVYTPAGKTEAYYCDATWVDPASHGGANVVFKNVVLGPGEIAFHLIETVAVDTEGNLIYEKPSDLHTEGLAPLVATYSWIPFPPGSLPSKVHRLGSFTVVPMFFKPIHLLP